MVSYRSPSRSDLGTVIVYGREDCGVCKAAVEKLRAMGVPHRKVGIGERLEYHEGWKTDDSIEVSSAYYALDGHLPIVLVAGEYLDYPRAMRRVKELACRSPIAASAVAISALATAPA